MTHMLQIECCVNNIAQRISTEQTVCGLNEEFDNLTVQSNKYKNSVRDVIAKFQNGTLV